jgi:sucrose-6-phosphate hydrolase SacC (GH32 family)
MSIKKLGWTMALILSASCLFTRQLEAQQSNASQVKMKITRAYLNIPLGYQARMKLMQLEVNGRVSRIFPVQLAEDSVGYWIYIDVSEYKGQTISITCPATAAALKRIYQSDRINGSDSLYKESNRPQFHFTVKRGWSNDINGPIYYNGEYHLFWQAFPFGLSWNTGFMYWGHAVSHDLLHWKELAPALMLDSLGSPWSGTAVIDRNNDGGWGKNALVLYYTAFDRTSEKEVQCIAYSNDDAKTFTRYKGNPIIDSNWALGTTQTRDPKVFWYERAKVWVLVLFEKDGLSFYNSTDMRSWKRQSHFPGLHECPDFFELPVDGDSSNMKWVLHGGSSDYFIGSFDGKTFTPESGRLSYAEGKNERGDDILYAAQSFENMPGGRRVQMAWGRIFHPGMPFTQMMLFPTEFTLHRTPAGIRLLANPIREISRLHTKTYSWQTLTAREANEKLGTVTGDLLHVKVRFTLKPGNELSLRFRGNELIRMRGSDLPAGENQLELLLDKTSAEIFLNNGERYILRNINPPVNEDGLQFSSERYGPDIQQLDVYEMESIWKGQE